MEFSLLGFVTYLCWFDMFGRGDSDKCRLSAKINTTAVIQRRFLIMESKITALCKKLKQTSTWLNRKMNKWKSEQMNERIDK